MLLTILGGFVMAGVILGFLYLVVLTCFTRVLPIGNLFTFIAVVVLGWSLSAYLSPRYHYSTLEGIGVVYGGILLAGLLLPVLPRLFNGVTFVLGILLCLIHGVVSWWWSLPYWSTIGYTFGGIVVCVVFLIFAAIFYQKVFTKKEV